MNKIMEWVMDLSNVGKAVKSADQFLDGKKQILASLATALASTGLIIKNLSEQGTPYLLQLPHSVEFLAAAGGWIALFNGLKGEKIREKLDEIQTDQEVVKADTSQVLSEVQATQELPPPKATKKS